MINRQNAKPKRLLCLLLTLAMVLGMIPAMSLTAYALTGSGTEGDPIIATTYAELKDLMATAPKDGSTRYIKLGADLISNGNSNDNDLELVNVRARVDLDLAGHSITRDEYTADWSVFYVHCGYLTVRDSVGTGRVVENIRGAQYPNVFNVTSAAHLTIESGTFESKTGNVILGQGGTTVINGGTFTNESIDSNKTYRVIDFYAGNLTINGGDFRGQEYGIEFNVGVEVTINACTVSLSDSGGFLISVNGGFSLDSSRFGEYSKIVDAEGKELWYYHHLEGAYCRVIGPIPVTKVAIEGIIPPIAGETPSNIVGGDTVLEHCSIDKYIGGEHVGENTIEWYDGNTMNPVETFEAGRLYMVTIRLVADEGFSFSTKAAAYETLTVNGDDDAFVWKVQNDGKYAYIGYIFTCPATQTITSMGADVTGFELLNGYFEVEATPLDSTKYTIRDITWSDCHLTDDSPVITDSSMFEAGETWQLKLWFKPAYGYAISNPDTLPVTIAGQTATYVGTDGDYYGYKIEKTFSKYLHDYIDLSMDAPTAGMTPAEYAETIKIKNSDRFPYNNFEIGMVDCYRTDWVDFDTFAAGTTYFVYVEIDLKDDTSFEFAHHDSDITALLNGTAVEDYVVVDADSTWESNFNTYGGVQLSYQVYFTAKSEATGVTVSGTATSYGSDTDDVTVQLIKSGASDPAYEVIVKGNTAGYSISDVEAGTYTMKVMKQNHVTREYTVVVEAEDVNQDVKIHLLGDVNMDGKINISDATEIQKGIAGLVSLSDYQNKLADANSDGKTNVADATHIQKFIAGIITNL